MSDAMTGEYYATPPTLTDREQKKLRLTSDGSLVVSSSGGGGGASTIADGADVTQGAIADAAVAAGAAGTESAKFRRISADIGTLLTQFPASLGAKTGALSLSVVPNTDTPFNVQGQQARGATITVQPVVSGGRGSTTAPTAVVAGQVVDSWVGLNGQTACMLVSSNGTLIATATLTDGVSAGTTTVSVSSFGLIFNGTTFDRLKKPNATARLISSAATTNATSAKASAGDLFKVFGNNTTATKRYLKLYNKASAPTVGTDTPVLTIPLPGSAAFDISITAGQYFSTGIAYAITANAADADNTAIAAGDIECLHLIYA